MKMKRIMLVYLALLATGSFLPGQAGSQQNARCKAEPIPLTSKSADLRPKPGASFKGYKRSPIVAFDIDESGIIRHAKIKRSSGSATADDFALNQVRRWRFRPLPGCGIQESEAVVTIDFSS